MFDELIIADRFSVGYHIDEKARAIATNGRIPVLFSTPTQEKLLYRKMRVLYDGSIFFHRQQYDLVYRPGKVAMDKKWPHGGGVVVEFVCTDNPTFKAYLDGSIQLGAWEWYVNDWNDETTLYDLLGDGVWLDPIGQTACFNSQASAICFSRQFPEFNCSYHRPVLLDMLGGTWTSTYDRITAFYDAENAVVFKQVYPSWIVHNITSTPPDVPAEYGRVRQIGSPHNDLTANVTHQRVYLQ